MTEPPKTNERDLKEYALPLFLMVGSGVLLGLGKLDGGINLNAALTWENYSSLFTNLVFVALLVERFIEVFLGVVRIEGKQRIQKDIDYAKDDEERKGAEVAMAGYRSTTARRAMQIAFAVGLFASLGGVRVLHVLFDASALASWQPFLFDLTDVLLTAGLIAGGSSGINKVTALFAGHLERRTELAKKVTTT